MALAPGFLTALLIALAKGAVRFQTALANRRAAKDLLDWDTRSLKDIGLTRSDVRGALSLPVNEDPTHFLSLIAAGGEVRSRRDGVGHAQPQGLGVASKTRLGTLPSAEPALCA